MTISPESTFKGPARVSRTRFAQLVREKAAPDVAAERDPGQYWDAIVQRGGDPLFVLAIFNHESSMGRNGVARETKSWGNTRTPNFGAASVGTADGASGTFPIWRTWLDGCISTIERLMTPAWVYSGTSRNSDTGATYGGRFSIREIFDHPSEKVWAPAGDFNNPSAYLRDVVDFMNRNADLLTTPSPSGRDPRFAWQPDEYEFGYPARTHGRAGWLIELMIIHFTDGTNSAGHLLGQNGSSAHVLTDRAMRPRLQMVDFFDAAWTPGNQDYACRSINVEAERPRSEPWTRAAETALAETVLPILKAHNLPLVYLGRDNGPGKRGLIGHADVPDPDGSGWGGRGNHDYCPGDSFNWAWFITELRRMEGGVTVDGPLYFPETDKSIDGGFRAYWQSYGGLAIFGLPLTGEKREMVPILVGWVGPDDAKEPVYELQERTVQYFERAVFEHHPGTWPERFDVLLRRVGAVAAGQAGYAGPGIEVPDSAPVDEIPTDEIPADA